MALTLAIVLALTLQMIMFNKLLESCAIMQMGLSSMDYQARVRITIRVRVRVRITGYGYRYSCRCSHKYSEYSSRSWLNDTTHCATTTNNQQPAAFNNLRPKSNDPSP